MAQVEQLMITPDRRFEFVPKLGDQVIVFGEGTDIEKKFTKLLAFYKEGLNKVGWNKYSRINIAFENEVVCTRKDGVPPLEPVLTEDSLNLAETDEPPIADNEDEPVETAAAIKPAVAAKPSPKPAAVEKPAAAKPKAKASPSKDVKKAKVVKKEKEKAPAKQQPKAVYKPGNKSVNTSKKQKTP
jgi:cell division protein FtsQ